MIGIDTNVLLRWLLNDDPAQADRAAQVFDNGEMIFLSDIVLAEASWVLTRSYNLPRAAIARALRQAVSLSFVKVSDLNSTTAALTAYETGGPGLSDQLIVHLNHAAGCRTTLTFDKQAGEANLFTPVS